MLTIRQLVSEWAPWEEEFGEPTEPIFQTIEFPFDRFGEVDPARLTSGWGQLTELHAADLRFTPDEVAAFFNQVANPRLSPISVNRTFLL